MGILTTLSIGAGLLGAGFVGGRAGGGGGPLIDASRTDTYNPITIERTFTNVEGDRTLHFSPMTTKKSVTIIQDSPHKRVTDTQQAPTDLISAMPVDIAPYMPLGIESTPAQRIMAQETGTQQLTSLLIVGALVGGGAYFLLRRRKKK